eukprot:scaffold18974_cov132-Skeletonema_marinoi.AAC.7
MDRGGDKNNLGRSIRRMKEQSFSINSYMRVEAERSGSHVLMTVSEFSRIGNPPGIGRSTSFGFTCLLPEDGGAFHPLVNHWINHGGGGNERLNFGWGGR